MGRKGKHMNKERRDAVPSITVQADLALERVLTLELVRVTERAAVSAARLTGRGNEKAADQAAVDAMRRELNKLPIDGTIVIGEGERDEAPMLFIGETVGNKHGPRVDIAVDPLEGTTLCAKNMPGAIATMAMAEGGTLLNAPDVYMEKIAVGPGYPQGVVDLDAPPEENIRRLAVAKGVQAAEITALILDRPRHADLIASVRKVGLRCGSLPTVMSRVSFTRPIPPTPASTSTWASAARPKACWRRRPCAASAARCSAGWCSIPRKSANAPRKWVSRIRARSTRSPTW